MHISYKEPSVLPAWAFRFAHSVLMSSVDTATGYNLFSTSSILTCNMFPLYPQHSSAIIQCQRGSAWGVPSFFHHCCFNETEKIQKHSLSIGLQLYRHICLIAFMLQAQISQTSAIERERLQQWLELLVFYREVKPLTRKKVCPSCSIFLFQFSCWTVYVGWELLNATL